MKRVRAYSSQLSYTELYDCQRYYYEVPSCYSTVYLSLTTVHNTVELGLIPPPENSTETFDM